MRRGLLISTPVLIDNTPQRLIMIAGLKKINSFVRDAVHQAVLLRDTA
jgi:hypothetical protein